MRARLRAGRSAARRCRKHLSERALTVLATVDRYRYMSARQIEQLHFSCHATPLTGARTCRRVLERLTMCGALWRLERRIGGVRAGSASFVYTLSPLGFRILNGDEENRVRHREPSERFLDHTLAISQLAVDVCALAQRRDDIDVISVEPEPDCWRRFTVGLEGVQILKPDLLVALRVGEFDYHWFIEVDLATHSASAVVRKCHIYHRYWVTGAEQDRCGVFPRVLLVAPSVRRASLLERNIDAARSLNRDLFAVTTDDAALRWLVGEPA